jgi:hypothetical protein
MSSLCKPILTLAPRRKIHKNKTCNDKTTAIAPRIQTVFLPLCCRFNST